MEAAEPTGRVPGALESISSKINAEVMAGDKPDCMKPNGKH